MGAASTDNGQLTVSFLDAVRTLGPDDALEFGRGAELDIDRSPLLHRVVGRFVHHGDSWWVQNLGSRIDLVVDSVGDRWSTLVPPGTQAALTAARSTVRFGVGAARYELGVRCSGHPLLDRPVPPADLESTLPPTTVALGDEHRALLATMARRRLTGEATDQDLPTSQEVADRLGWTLKKVNRKVDWLCAKYADAGVPGLRGAGVRSNERRRRIVDHVIATGEVTTDDLALADAVAARGTSPGAAR